MNFQTFKFSPSSSSILNSVDLTLAFYCSVLFFANLVKNEIIFENELDNRQASSKTHKKKPFDKIILKVGKVYPKEETKNKKKKKKERENFEKKLGREKFKLIKSSITLK